MIRLTIEDPSEYGLDLQIKRMSVPGLLEGIVRTGFTTGACAQAGVRACLDALVNGVWAEKVRIRLPNGRNADFSLKSYESGMRGGLPWALASIIKDGGDDPDCTHGAEIITEIRLTGEGRIIYRAGTGVGRITKPGLAIPVGDPAINPVPRKFMSGEFLASKESIAAHLALGNPGIEITISIPDGEQRSEKTLNARLGIVGGLSILGTKGIVVPFSTAAYRASIGQALEVARARNLDTVVMTTGGQSEAFAMKLYPDLPQEGFVQIGDFTGYSVRQAARTGIRRIIMAGFLGKFSKLAKGVTQTHAAGSQVDLSFLVDLARQTGSSEEVCAEILKANTARHVGEILEASGNTKFFPLLCRNIVTHLKRISPHPPEMEILLANFRGELIGRAGSSGE